MGQGGGGFSTEGGGQGGGANPLDMDNQRAGEDAEEKARRKRIDDARQPYRANTWSTGMEGKRSGDGGGMPSGGQQDGFPQYGGFSANWWDR